MTEKYADYLAYREALDKAKGESPKSYDERIAQLTYERGYLQGRIDALKERLGEGTQP